MPPFARLPIPFAGKQAGGVPPLGLGAPPGLLAPLAHTRGRGGAAPVSTRPPVRMLPLRAPPEGALPGLRLPGRPARNAEGRGRRLGLGAPPRLAYRPGRNPGGAGLRAAPLCADGGGAQRVRGGYPFPARPLACVSPLRANRGRRGDGGGGGGGGGGPFPFSRHLSRAPRLVRLGHGEGCAPIARAPDLSRPPAASFVQRGLPTPSWLRGVPLLGLHAARALRSAHPTVRASSRSAQRGARRGWYTSPARSRAHPARFRASLVTCGYLRTPRPVHVANGEGWCARTHPFAHPVRTPRLRARARTGRACAYPPLSARGQQSTRKRGGHACNGTEGAQGRRLRGRTNGRGRVQGGGSNGARTETGGACAPVL